MSITTPPIHRNDPNPGTDGQVTTYINPEAQTKAWFQPNRPLIFVNGMDNTGKDHAEAAMGLSLMMGCPVLGVYNKDAGKLRDLIQCLKDKLTLHHSSDTALEAIFEASYQHERGRRPGLSKEAFLDTVLAENKATQALFRLLIGQPDGKLGLPIYCHSQGNLITSNALRAVVLSRGASAVQGLEVNSFGSPARNWPSGLRRTNYAFSLDPVSWLDLRMDWSSSKVGFKGAHAFEEYRKHDGEFVVNRFRTGGMGMTVNMDERGLARFCVNLGNHTDRLRRIFDRLEKVHFTDSDDVALIYCQMLSDTQLQALNRTDPAFITQLIRLLEAGWTAQDEKVQIARLQRAQGSGGHSGGGGGGGGGGGW